MTDRGESTDINFLPDADIQNLIAASQDAAWESGQRAKFLEEELSLVKWRVDRLQQKRSSLILRAQAAQAQVRQLQDVLAQRHEIERRAAIVDRLSQKLLKDAGMAAKSPTPIARGFSRVLYSLGKDHREGLLNLIDIDSPVPSHVSRKINVRTENGDGAFMRLGVNGEYLVGYNIKSQTPENVCDATVKVHAIGAEEPYAREYGLHVIPHHIGFGIDFLLDESMVTTSLVMLVGQNSGEYRALPHAKATAQPVIDFIGGILQTGEISLPKPQQVRRY